MVALPPGYRAIWRPHPGPQEAFIRAREFEVFYGGAKGGGKSDAILGGATRQVHLPAYKALILRATYRELGELLRRARQLFTQLPSKPEWNGEWQEWRFPARSSRLGAQGAVIRFGHCRTVQDVELYQGQEWAYVGFDELGNVPDERVWTDLLKEIRCPDKSIVRMARGTGNPGFAGHAWTKKRFISACGKHGDRVVRFEFEVLGRKVTLERRFIPAKITDNPVYANDAAYLATLASLPEVRRRQLLDGDYDVGIGLALDELDERVHVIKPFRPPPHWTRFGGLDWGFAHRWVFVDVVADEDGTLYVLDTVRGWRDLPDQIIERIRRHVPVELLRYVAAGHDLWNRIRARGENGPTIAEQMLKAGIPVMKANIDRVQGLNRLRDYTAFRGRGPGGRDWEPGLCFCDTAGNRWLFEQLEGMVTDPDDPEDALKTDCDPETGEGGDDGYDALRYAVMSRPPRSPSIGLDRKPSAWDPEVLAAEADRTHRVRAERVESTPTIGELIGF